MLISGLVSLMWWWRDVTSLDYVLINPPPYHPRKIHLPLTSQICILIKLNKKKECDKSFNDHNHKWQQFPTKKNFFKFCGWTRYHAVITVGIAVFITSFVACVKHFNFILFFFYFKFNPVWCDTLGRKLVSPATEKHSFVFFTLFRLLRSLIIVSCDVVVSQMRL